MAGIQTIKVTLQRDSLQTPWGFRLQGGADFRTPFTVNKITAGSPADGVLHRGDIILEIDQRPISAILHGEALELVQRAGGQVTFLIQRGPNSSPLASFSLPRPLSAMPWSLANATSYLDRSFNPPWSPSANPLSPTSFYRSRALERISEPKPVLSQTGSPIMPGPVPSVSTKTRGYVQPPTFHTERSNLFNTSPIHASYSPDRFLFPSSNFNNRPRTMSNAGYQTTTTTSQQNSYNSSGYNSDVYVPSYQKKVQVNPSIQQQRVSNQNNQRSQQQQQFITVNKPQQQQQNYRPASVQPMNLVHRQFNSPMSLYSNDNVQDVMQNHVSHISRVSFIPSLPKLFNVSVSPSRPNYSTSSTPICYIQPTKNVYASDF